MPAREEMPSTLQRSPKKAQETWGKTHDSAVEEYGEFISSDSGHGVFRTQATFQDAPEFRERLVSWQSGDPYHTVISYDPQTNEALVVATENMPLPRDLIVEIGAVINTL